GNQTMTGYPALAPAPDGKSVAIRLLDTRDRADESHRDGVKILMALELRELLRQLDRRLPELNAAAMRWQAAIRPDKRKDDLMDAMADRAFSGEDAVRRRRKASEEQKRRGRARMPGVADGTIRHANAVVEANQELLKQLGLSASLGRVVQDVKAARDRLV